MKNKFKKIINADGRMTILGVSTISDNVAEFMKYGGQNYFLMKEFKEQINDELKQIIGSDNIHIVNSASSGISLSVAAAIYKNRIYDVNKVKITKNEIVIAKGHNIDFGAPIENLIYLVGGKVQEAGYANRCSKEDFEYQINENTAALIYVVSHHCVQKSMLTLQEAIDVSKKFNIPLIVDCAAEDDFKKYSILNIDVVVFSGSKAIEGPTSGFVFGKNAELISNLKAHSNIIGRVMKIGKENILGLYKALLDYKKNNNIDYISFQNIFEKNKYIQISKSIDNRGIERIKFNLKDNFKKIYELFDYLKNLNPSIYLRPYLIDQGYLEIDLRSITLEEAEIINKEIDRYLGGKNEN